MARFEVTFTVYEQHEVGKASVSSSLLTNQRTTVEATNSIVAQKLVESQYGPKCKAFGARQV